MWWKRVGVPVPPSVRDPESSCKYCKTRHKWRMEIWGHVILTCAKHVDEALDEYLEMRGRGEVPTP